MTLFERDGERLWPPEHDLALEAENIDEAIKAHVSARRASNPDDPDVRALPSELLDRIHPFQPMAGPHHEKEVIERQLSITTTSLKRLAASQVSARLQPDELRDALGDPLREPTRTAKRNLAIFSATLLALLLLKAKPADGGFLGMSFTDSPAWGVPLVLTVVVFYELVQFAFYARSDHWQFARRYRDTVAAAKRIEETIELVAAAAACLPEPLTQWTEAAARELSVYRRATGVARQRAWFDLYLPTALAAGALLYGACSTWQSVFHPAVAGAASATSACAKSTGAAPVGTGGGRAQVASKSAGEAGVAGAP